MTMRLHELVHYRASNKDHSEQNIAVDGNDRLGCKEETFISFLFEFAVICRKD